MKSILSEQSTESMRSYRKLGLIILLFTLGYSSVAFELSDKAGKYLRILLRRPAPNYVFDRFGDAWLEKNPSENLGKYLDAEYQRTKNPAYLLLSAFHYQKEGMDEKALDYFSKAAKLAPGNAAILFYKIGRAHV